MAAVTSWYQHYFDNLAYRSGQYQMAALGDKEKFLDFNDPKERWGNKDWWNRQQALDVIADKPWKELKQIESGWKTGSSTLGTASTTYYFGPNGDPFDNKGYYTQKTKFDGDYINGNNDIWAKQARQDVIARDAERYDEWEQMHDGVVWFDTAACWKGGFIGDINSVESTISATATRSTYGPNSPPTQSITRAFNGDIGETWGNNWWAGATYDTTT